MGMYGCDPACETAPDVLAERERIAGELTGMQISCEATEDAIEQDAVYLFACTSDDLCEIGRLFKRHAMAAMSRAVDERMARVL